MRLNQPFVTTSPMKKFKSGFVSIVGRPNVGKSTLLNTFLGEKVAITTHRPQTTRNRIMGIYNSDDSQILFLDTPGIHKPRNRLGNYMVRTAMESLDEVDLSLFVVEPVASGQEDRFIVERLVKSHVPSVLVVNKVDTVESENLLPVIDEYMRMVPFVEVVPVSALKGVNTGRLLSLIKGLLPEGPRYYPEDMVTDQLERFMVAEIVREKAMLLTRQEVPYALAVEVDEFKERSGGSIYIHAVIYVERESQKGIIIGKAGALLKKIGTSARKGISRLLGAEIYLELRVKVKADWRDSRHGLKDLGYD